MMNKELVGQESNEINSKTKLFGVSRPWAGAFIGVALFFVIEFLLWRAELGELAMGLTYPGLLIEAFGIPLDFFAIGVSSIPAAIIGSLFFSKMVSQKVFGSILLVIHIVVSLIFSIFFSIMAD